MHMSLQIASSVFEKYYWIFADSSNKGLPAFIYKQSNNLNGEFKW